MFEILADNAYNPAPFDNLAVVADFFYRSFYFHVFPRLFYSEGNTPPRKIVRGQFQFHFISGQDADEMHAHLSRNMSQDKMSVFQLDFKDGVRQRFNYRPFGFDMFFFWHS